MSPPDDGVLDVVLVTCEEKVMAAEIDATIRLSMDQQFAGSQSALQNGFAAGAVRTNNSANFVTETTQLMHQSSMQLVGAKAAGQLDRDSLSKGILDARNAAGQPSNGPTAT